MFQLETLSKQKSHAKWLAEGGLNTSYFHRAVRWRRIKNKISGLHLENGWCEDPKRVKDEIRNKFRIRFAEHERVNMKLDHINFLTLTDDENEQLIKEISEEEEEVRGAVWECDGSKSPGPDGFNINFSNIPGILLR